MADLNKVFLIGNLTRDPEMRQVSDRASVTKFGLATNRRFTTRSGEERDETCFVDIEVWGRQAESCNQYLRKGAPAFVEGRLTLDQWEDQNGQRRSKLYVRADRVQFLGSPSRGSDFQDGGQASYGAPADGGYAQPQPQQQAPAPPQAPAPQAPPAAQPPPQQGQPPPPPQPPPENQMPKFEENDSGQTEDDIPF